LDGDGAGAAGRPLGPDDAGRVPAFSDVVATAARTLYLLSTDDFVADTSCFDCFGT